MVLCYSKEITYMHSPPFVLNKSEVGLRLRKTLDIETAVELPIKLPEQTI